MTTKELKEKYLKFFKTKGHKIIPNASLVPENDPTVLFTTAGMHPLIPYLLGEKHAQGKKLASVQKCIRTKDIEEVGDDVHLTFFEMLGNWSLGSYWKEEAIKMSFEFLFSKKWLNLDKNKLAISCFKGELENNIPKDKESAEVWKKLGISEQRIVFLDRKENWWGPAGKTGPCGPDTEMFYWSDPSTSPAQAPEKFNSKDSKWVEIWNDVFMQYNKTAENKYRSLKQKNVDTGMGVERTVMVLNNKKNVYEVEPLKSIVKLVKKLARIYDERSARIIADHLRTAIFILSEKIEPSNLERGYIARRLIRRAVRYGKKIGISKPFTPEIGKKVIELMGGEYLELNKNKDFIIKQLIIEEEKFSKTLKKGLKEFDKIATKTISGKQAFELFATYGFPLEITKELAQEKGLKIDEKEFQKEFKKHQEISRTATAGKFKSGLADHSKEVTKLHTATHLLLAALRKVLGNHVYQEGSNITKDRLRFDFSYLEKLTDKQIKEIEDLVNKQIKKDLPVICEEMSLEKAKEMGAIGVFESKYKNKVKVYNIGGDPSTGSGPAFSQEICNGPHVKSTGELGCFKILKENSSSAGVRRIKAILE